MAGLRYLVRSETAARIEIAVSTIALIWLVILGCSLGEIVILLVLFCILMSVEALNTAIEVIVDHLSPEHSEFAKAAKDLGSLAVFCLLCAGGLYVLVLTAAKAGIVHLW